MVKLLVEKDKGVISRALDNLLIVDTKDDHSYPIYKGGFLHLSLVLITCDR